MISAKNSVKHNTSRKLVYDFCFLLKMQFQKNIISSKIMSHQVFSEANFKQLENLLKLTTDKFQEKFLSFMDNRIVYLD